MISGWHPVTACWARSSTGYAASTSSADASIALLVLVSRIYVGGSREGVRILTGHAFRCEEGCGAREHSESTVRVGRGRSAPFGTHAAESVAALMRQRRSLRSGLWPQRLLPTRPQLWPAPVPPLPSPSCPRARARGRGRTKLGKHLLQIMVRLRRRLKVQQVVLARVRLPFVC